MISLIPATPFTKKEEDIHRYVSTGKWEINPGPKEVVTRRKSMLGCRKRYEKRNCAWYKRKCYQRRTRHPNRAKGGARTDKPMGSSQNDWVPTGKGGNQICTIGESPNCCACIWVCIGAGTKRGTKEQVMIKAMVDSGNLTTRGIVMSE